jgi:hypothetical protein
MKTWLSTAALAAIGALAAQAQPAARDALLSAMHDEVGRSLGLALPGSEKPYFIEYHVDDIETVRILASFGGLVSRSRSPNRTYAVHVRVGNYRFDTSNFLSRGSGVAGFDLPGFPLEPAYDVLRRYLWLSTDQAYKAAVDRLAHKQASMNRTTASETLDDFAHAAPVVEIAAPRRLEVDEDAWAERVKSLSGIPNQYPEIQSSNITFYATAGAFYLANTEGSEVRAPTSEAVLRVWMVAQASDGMRLRDSIAFHAPDSAGLPPEAEMRRQIAAMAENAVAFSKAPKGEEYSGPVLFEGVAGAQILAEVLGHNFTLVRQPVLDQGMNFFAFGNELAGRKGSRILPDWMDVIDDPTVTSWHGQPLVGSYTIDREAVPAKPVQLVEKGVLKDYLRTRQVVHGYSDSNGRAQLSNGMLGHTAAISNLFVNVSQSVPVAELRRKLMETCKERDKAYGIVVRRMDYPSVATVEEATKLAQSGIGSGTLPVSLPVRIFKLYADGHEEQVRGLVFRGLNAKSLKDIVAAGDDSAPFHFAYSHGLFALMDIGAPTRPATVVAPSILVDDLDLKPIEGDLPKLPIAAAPAIARR